MSSTTPTPKFEVGELLVCLSAKDNKPYEAKVMEIKEHKGVICYKIHFSGWNNRYDERVPVGHEDGKLFKESLSAYNSARGLPNATPDQKTAKRKSSIVRAPSATPSTAPSVETAAPSEAGDDITERTYQLLFPEPLKKILVDDQQLMTRGFWCKIPAARCVDDILGDFVKSLPPTAEGDEDVHHNSMMELTTKGIIDYFNAVCGKQLMYKDERRQYDELVAANGGKKKEKELRCSAHYGFIHLLRIMPRLPKLLGHAIENEQVKTQILTHANDILDWLNDNRDEYKTEYVAASK